MIAVGRAIEHLRQTARIDSGLEGGRSLGAERPTIYGTVGIALDVNHLAIFDVDIEAATNGAIGADAFSYLCITNAGSFLATFGVKGCTLEPISITSETTDCAGSGRNVCSCIGYLPQSRR